MNEKPIRQHDFDAVSAAVTPAVPTALAAKAARRLRMTRLSRRIAESVDRLVRAEEKARARLGHPVWTDRLRTR
jgi:hypothetical protein